MKTLSLPASVTALLTTAIFAVTAAAQAPQAPAGGPGHDHGMGGGAPKNLQVLPKTMTMDQVHELMEQWAGSLGVHCGTCHAEDPKNVGPNGRPRLNFADDSKPGKATARLMYGMTEDINKNYVSKVPSADMPVSCGTCHRGHLDPEPFIVPPDDHGPHPAPGAAPSAATPAQSK